MRIPANFECPVEKLIQQEHEKSEDGGWYRYQSILPILCLKKSVSDELSEESALSSATPSEE